jgi:MFS family permease
MEGILVPFRSRPFTESARSSSPVMRTERQMNESSDSPRPDIGDYLPDRTRGKLAAYTARVFSSFRYPAYRMYVYSMIGHWAPMQMQMIVRTLLIYRLTGSGTIIGIMALANSIPMLLLSLYGGALADRVEKRQLLFWSQSGLGILALAVAIALSTGYLSAENEGSWWVLVVSSGIQGTIFGLMMPGRITILPEIVEPKDLMNAISLNNMGMNLFRIFAPAAGGFIIAAWDFPAAYYIMAVMYLASNIFVFGLPKMPPKITGAANPFREIIEGMRYIRKETVIMLVLTFVLGCTILGMPFNLLLPMFTEDPNLLNVGEEGLGILMGVSGVGAIVISIVLASIQDKRRGLIMLMMGLLLSISLIMFSFINAWIPALLIVVLVGMGQTGQMAIGTTLVQYHVDPVYRGRVMSFLMLGFGLSSLGTVFGGILADAMGIQWAVGGLAVILLVVTLIILVFGKRLRQLD